MEEGLLARSIFQLSLVACTLLLSACQPKHQPEPTPVDFTSELPQGQMALRKISPGEYPQFALDAGSATSVIKAIDNSLQYLAAPSSKGFFPYLDITHDRAIATLNAMREVVNSPLLMSRGNVYLNEAIRSRFEVYQSIGAPNPDSTGYSSRVLFTGYCTPIYPASLTRTEKFRYPLYKRPSDLVRDEVTGQVHGRRMPDGSINPKYYSRTDIEKGNVLAGQELVWLQDRFDAYVIGVQGSGRLRLPDGKMLEIGYAGTNGYDYTSPSDQMLKDRKITKQQRNLKSLRAHFVAHPADLDHYISLNQRFVFFAERPGGPFGSLNVPVTAFASIATDKSVYPRSLPTFVMTKIPAGESGGQREYNSILLDQDTGGAIRAAGRCDIYMGIGEAAERLSGQQLHEGKLYYFAIKPELVPQYITPAAPRVPKP